MRKPLTLWILGDGKPGHENQSLGLADAIARIMPCDVHRISLAGVRGWIGRIRAADHSSSVLPEPSLIIGAGHATHPSLLWLARKHRARSVVLMRPSLPMRWFHLCLVPEHDYPHGSVRKNLVLTRGALNRVAPPSTATRQGKIMLIGGPSASHGWHGDALISALREIAASDCWQLTDSRRTPDGFIEKIQCDHIEIFPHQQTLPDWLPEKLAAADTVWVTEDSVSMVYEALSSGARVGLLPAPRLGKSSRVMRGIDELISRQFLTPFAEWQQSHQLNSAPEILREADRCAEILLRTLDWNGS